MTNAKVFSAPVKPDKHAPHTNDGRNNIGKARNHEKINDRCKTGNKMINDDNHSNLKPTDVLITLRRK